MQDRSISLQTGPISHVKLTLNDTTLAIQKFTQSKPLVHHDIGHRHVLKACFDVNTRVLEVAYLARKKKALHLVLIQGTVEESQAEHSRQWSESVMKAVYDDAGIKRARRLMVFVNPYGGRKKGASIFMKTVEPVLRVAGCSLEILYTTHQGQAYDVAKTLPLDFDAVLSVSGDGLIHEILNGFAHHADSSKAFATPVAPIPTGSGNGLSLNLLGINEGFDVLAATLNAIKGQPMKVDVFSFTQGGKRTVSFMSQAVGLMADLDVGTDNLRWMGDTRFLYGLLRGIITNKAYPIELSYKLAESDKHKMAREVGSRNQTLNGNNEQPLSPSRLADLQPSLNDSPSPGKQSEISEEEEWTPFPHPITYVYAGKGPYVGRDFMAFPVSLPDDGLIDLAVMTNSSRGDIISAMDGAAEGMTYWHPRLHYVKVHAYRVKPLEKGGHLAVDGEKFPFEEFQVEVHKGLATLLSLYGHYAANFRPRAFPTVEAK